MLQWHRSQGSQAYTFLFRATNMPKTCRSIAVLRHLRYYNSTVWIIFHINTKKYHVFAPMGRFQLESIYLYFPAGTTVENKGKFFLTIIAYVQIDREISQSMKITKFLTRVCSFSPILFNIYPEEKKNSGS